MTFEKRINFDAERVFDFNFVGPAFSTIPPPFERPIRLTRMANTTDALLIFSFDGITDQITLGPSDSILLNTQQFSSPNVEAVFPKNTTVYVRHTGVAPTMGAVIVNTGFVE